ncbi:MAG TPA: TIGR02569 family protein [Pseudonocardia sp.]|nr:TIGR02569 family protein [Pseudonocardia sp.]
MSTATDDRPVSDAGASLPAHVQTAFGVRETEAQPIHYGGLPGFRCGDVVIRPVRSNVVAAWSARVLDTLKAEKLRIARPQRSSDGRWVVAGWSACQYLPGEPQGRYQDLVAASLRLHAATASVRRPRFMDDQDDLLSRADAAAWGECTINLDPSAGGDLFDELAVRRRQLRLPAQVVHGDLFGTVLFDRSDPRNAPAIVDLVPFWRPVEWAAAVIVVDALAWGGADASLLRTWSHLDGWPQAMLRALMFRVALHAQHPGATAVTLRGLEHAAELILPTL